MASFITLHVDNGSLKETNENYILSYIHFPVSISFTASYQTELPDPYYTYTQSLDVTTTSNTVSQSISAFSLQQRNEESVYVSEYLTRVSSAAAATAAARPKLSTLNVGDALTFLRSPLSLTTTQYRFYGSEQTKGENTAANAYAANNVSYPHFTSALMFRQQNLPFSNSFSILSSANGTSVRAGSGSFESHQFIGISASLSYVFETASKGPLTFSSSYIATINSPDLITSSILPATKSLWLTASLTSANVTTTSATAYATVLTLTGMKNGKTYYVQYYTPVFSNNTAAGVRQRIATGSNYTGTIYCVDSNTSTLQQNSADGTSIINIRGGAWPVANSPRLNFGELLVTKTAAGDPVIGIVTETGGQTAAATTGSIAIYREIDSGFSNRIIETPVTIVSGSITAHSKSDGKLLQIPSSVIPDFSLYNAPFWESRIRPPGRVTSVTGQTPSTVTDLQLTLANNAYYLIIGYVGVSSSAGGVCPRPGITTANLQLSAWSIETMNGETAVAYGNNATTAGTTGGSGALTNYYLCKIRAVVRTAAAGTPTQELRIWGLEFYFITDIDIYKRK
jgi:hypothetical protein